MQASIKKESTRKYAVTSSYVNNSMTYHVNSTQKCIIPYQALELEALKREVANLENQLTDSDTQKTDIEKMLSDFHHMHTQELGSYISHLIQLRKIVHRYNPQKLDELEQDELAYTQQIQEDKNQVFYELDSEQKKEMKKCYRKASQICHPDRVDDAFKDTAQEIFIELTKAYKTNDLTRVQALFTEIQQGIFQPRSAKVHERETLQSIRDALQLKLTTLKTEVFVLKDSDTYRMIISIPSWTIYFEQVKEQLIDEITTIQVLLD